MLKYYLKQLNVVPWAKGQSLFW